jgi:DNA-nicking Smr family endonuclease
MNQGIVEVDVHGMNKYQAKTYLDSQIRRAGKEVYRIRVIHGYRGGTELKDMIRQEYGRKHPKILRLEIGLNPGETDLVLREL